MPKPYRRSCSDCVKAKRRCDLGLPSCHRCKTKHLTCTYEGRSINLERTDDDLWDKVGTQLSVAISNAFAVDVDLASWSQNVNGIGQDPPSLELQPEALDSNFSLPAFSDNNLDWLEFMTDVDGLATSDHPRNTTSNAQDSIVGDAYQARVVYIVKRMKLFPGQFVEKGQNPFVNCHLYGRDMPPYLHDAIALCALYTCKNDSNKSLISSAIREKVSTLIQTHDDKMNNSRFPSSKDGVHDRLICHLSALQALLLYQIIRLFDGDLRLRSDAERDASTLITWTDKMKDLMFNDYLGDNKGTIVFDTSNILIATWHEWLLAESMHRTIITSNLFWETYEILRSGQDKYHKNLMHLSFCAQGALWWAPAEHNWCMARHTLPYRSVAFNTRDIDIAQVQPHEAEELAVLIIALVSGMAKCCEWLGFEHVAKYGLAWQYNTA